MQKKTLYELYIKRALDIICSLLAIIVFSWLYVLIALLVRVKLGKPVLFRQKRVGKNENIFVLFKFRTMSDKCDEHGNLLPDELRLTKFGKWLRATSLDELPEAFNILHGDMSIIGPRPLVVQYLPFYTSEERIRHTVRPGLSGLAQVNGRNGLQWEERFAYDIEYVKNITFWGDVQILLRTIYKAIRKEDVVVRGTGKTIDFDQYRKNQRKEEK